MKAAVRHEYGPPDVLKVEEVPTPTPRDDELLIRVHAASVNLGDWELLTGRPLFITVLARIFTRKPRYQIVSPAGKRGLLQPKFKILGADLAGRVEAVGRSVTRFQPGDEVFGDCAISGFGAFAVQALADARRHLYGGGRFLEGGVAIAAPGAAGLEDRERKAMLLAASRSEDLVLMTEWFEAGTVVPVIDRCYPLSETREALRCLGEKQSKGKVIITP